MIKGTRTLDAWRAGQKADRDIAAATLASVETAKQLATKEVADAKIHVEEVAGELQEDIQATSDKIDFLATNHLAHIQTGIESLNGKTDKVIEVLQDVGIWLKECRRCGKPDFMLW